MPCELGVNPAWGDLSEFKPLNGTGGDVFGITYPDNLVTASQKLRYHCISTYPIGRQTL